MFLPANVMDKLLVFPVDGHQSHASPPSQSCIGRQEGVEVIYPFLRGEGGELISIKIIRMEYC